MKKASYEKIKSGGDFILEFDKENRITAIKNKTDPLNMNWVREGERWGLVTGEAPLSLSVSRDIIDGAMLETYAFANETQKKITVSGTSLAISLPLPDFYGKAGECMARRCHAHIWCGQSSGYICALRMGAEGPNLGLILRHGGLKGYGIERKAEVNVSNDRGIFLLYPEDFSLRPEESYVISWELFWFKDKADFRRRLGQTKNHINITAPRYVLFLGEELSFSFADCGKTRVLCGGEDIPFTADGGKIRAAERPEKTGELNYYIYQNSLCAQTSFLVLPPLWDLAEKRCRFIAEKQQCLNPESPFTELI